MHKYATSWSLLNLSMNIWELMCAQWQDLIGLMFMWAKEQSLCVGEVFKDYLYSHCSQVSVFYWYTSVKWGLCYLEVQTVKNVGVTGGFMSDL